MSTNLVTRYRESFYRETAAGMYKGALFPIAHFIIEVPWVIGLSFLVSVCPQRPAALIGLIRFEVGKMFRFSTVTRIRGHPPFPMQAVSLLYFTVNFNTDADRFFLFWLATLLVYLLCVAKSLMLSLLMPNHQVLMILFGLTQNMWWYVVEERYFLSRVSQWLCLHCVGGGPHRISW
jgi:hypothetical protein